MTTVKINSSLKTLNIESPQTRHLDRSQLSSGKKTVDKMARDMGVESITVERLLRNQLPASSKPQLQTLKTFLRQALNKPGTTEKGNAETVRAYISDVDQALVIKQTKQQANSHAADALLFTSTIELAQKKLKDLGSATQLANLRDGSLVPSLYHGPGEAGLDLKTLDKEVFKYCTDAMAIIKSHPNKAEFLAILKRDVLVPLQRLRMTKRT